MNPDATPLSKAIRAKREAATMPSLPCPRCDAGLAGAAYDGSIVWECGSMGWPPTLHPFAQSEECMARAERIGGKK